MVWYQRIEVLLSTCEFIWGCSHSDFIVVMILVDSCHNNVMNCKGFGVSLEMCEEKVSLFFNYSQTAPCTHQNSCRGFSSVFNIFLRYRNNNLEQMEKGHSPWRTAKGNTNIQRNTFNISRFTAKLCFCVLRGFPQKKFSACFAVNGKVIL